MAVKKKTGFPGVRFKEFPSRKRASDRLCFGFHGGQRGSTGLAVGIDFRATVDWIADKTSWLSNGLFSAGSVVIDPLGIVSVVVDET